MSEQPTGRPAIRVMMMPRDTNATGTIFGGVLLSYIDQAGAIAAREYAPHTYVTVAMDSVVFKEPVFVGDVLSFYATVVRVGRTSITIHVDVSAERFTDPRRIVPVTEAELTYVAVDDDRRPVSVAPREPAG
jgi:acyl-CoA thioesterase YciA